MKERSWPPFAETILAFAGDSPFEVDLREPLSAVAVAQLRGLGLGGAFAVITPCNPMGLELPAAENVERVEQLKRELLDLDVAFVPADGWSVDRSHVEHGFACSLPLEDAMVLARKWKQLALFWFDGATIQLLAVKQDDHYHERR